MKWAEMKTAFETMVRESIPKVTANPESENDYWPAWEQSSDRNQFANPEAGWKVIVDLISVRHVSKHQEHYTTEEQPDRLDEKVLTHSVMAFQVKAESDYFDDDASRWAARAVQKIKERVRLTRYTNLFRDADMAINTVGDTTNLSVPKDGRQISIFTCDLFFNVVSEENTEEDDSGDDWFERVIVTSEIKDATGALIPANRTFTIEET